MSIRLGETRKRVLTDGAKVRFFRWPGTRRRSRLLSPLLSRRAARGGRHFLRLQGLLRRHVLPRTTSFPLQRLRRRRYRRGVGMHGVRGGPIVSLRRRRKKTIVGRWNGVSGRNGGWMVVVLQVVVEVRRAETLLLVTFVRFHFFF